MNAILPLTGVRTPRQRDRRHAWHDLLATVTHAMDRRQDPPAMRGAFEEMLRRLVPVRTVQLRDAASRWVTRADETEGAESIALEVVGSDPASNGVLHATFDPTSSLDEWDFQQLGMCAHVGAMVLEIERLRVELARAGLAGTPRAVRDAVAPLIGTTPVMLSLRSSIERVAATDFTILIEGGSGR